MRNYIFLTLIVALFTGNLFAQTPTNDELKDQLDQTLQLVMNQQAQLNKLDSLIQNATVGMDSTAKAELLKDFIKAGHREYLSMPGKAAYRNTNKKLLYNDLKDRTGDLEIAWSDLDNFMDSLKTSVENNVIRLNDVESVTYDDDFDVEVNGNDVELNNGDTREAAKKRIRDRIKARYLNQNNNGNGSRVEEL